jgi:hypothetical protein
MTMTRADGPVYRSHVAMKFAAGVARVFAVLIAAATVVGSAATLAGSRSALVPVTFAVSGALVVLFLVIGFIYAVLFWAAADALIMLADSDDAHRLTQFQLAQLSAEIGTLRADRGGTASSDATERLFPPS